MLLERIVEDAARQGETTDLDLNVVAFGHEVDVVRLEIPVHYSLLVDILDGVQDIARQPAGLRLAVTDLGGFRTARAA